MDATSGSYLLRKFASKASKSREGDGRPKLVQQIDDHPRWYRQLAAFVNNDENFLMARKYSFLKHSTLLYLQDDVSALEKDLIRLDADDTIERDGKFDEDLVHSRKVLIEKIDNKLKEYDELLSRTKTSLALKAPALQNTKASINRIEDHKSLSSEQFTFIPRKDDYKAHFDSQKCDWLEKKLFTPKEQAEEPDDDYLTAWPSSAYPSPTSSFRPSSSTNSTPVNRLGSASLASRTIPLCQKLFGCLLALQWMISPAFAAQDNGIPTSQPNFVWPFNEGPPGLWDFIFAIITAMIVVVCICSENLWPEKFQDPARGLLLLGFCTFGGFCIMGDGTTSLTTLLSIGALQVYFSQSFARMRHRMPDGRWYTMSVHFWPLIFPLTIVFALLCKKASPTMYNQNAQLPWFPFTIPCFGVAVAVCVYLGYLYKSWDVSPLPQYIDDRRRHGSL